MRARALQLPFVARYTPAGALDRTFGSGGVVRTPAAAGTLGAVAVQADGRIVVAGGGPSGGGAPGNFVLARYDASGRPDTSFDRDGVAFTDFGLGAVAVGLAIQRDGKIVAVGNARSAASRDALEFAVARYNADGSLDAGFGGDGRVTTPFTPVVDSAVDAAVQPDGRIVVGGYAGYSFSLPNSPQRPDYALARYNADGSLDASFDGDGKTTSAGICAGSGPCLTGDLALQTDGKILLAGGQVARFDRDGSLDSAFGREGRAAPDLHARSVLVQPDGKIVAAGGTAAPRGDFAVARLLPSGQRDRSFGTAGRATADLGGGTSDGASAAALQSDRRIVLAGTVEVREVAEPALRRGTGALHEHRTAMSRSQPPWPGPPCSPCVGRPRALRCREGHPQDLEEGDEGEGHSPDTAAGDDAACRWEGERRPGQGAGVARARLAARIHQPPTLSACTSCSWSQVR